MWLAKLTYKLFGWNWVYVNFGFGDWKLRRVYTMWDGKLWVKRAYRNVLTEAPPHDYVTGIWLNPPPAEQGKGSGE